jgi:hypothetical protein
MCKSGSGLSVDTALRNGSCQIFLSNFQRSFTNLSLTKYPLGSRDSSVCTATRLWVVRPGSRGSISLGGKRLFSSP